MGQENLEKADAILAGPAGVGKTTTARDIVGDAAQEGEFVTSNGHEGCTTVEDDGTHIHEKVLKHDGQRRQVVIKDCAGCGTNGIKGEDRDISKGRADYIQAVEKSEAQHLSVIYLQKYGDRTTEPSKQEIRGLMGLVSDPAKHIQWGVTGWAMDEHNIKIRNQEYGVSSDAEARRAYRRSSEAVLIKFGIDEKMLKDTPMDNWHFLDAHPRPEVEHLQHEAIARLKDRIFNAPPGDPKFEAHPELPGQDEIDQDERMERLQRTISISNKGQERYDVGKWSFVDGKLEGTGRGHMKVNNWRNALHGATSAHTKLRFMNKDQQQIHALLFENLSGCGDPFNDSKRQTNHEIDVGQDIGVETEYVEVDIVPWYRSHKDLWTQNCKDVAGVMRDGVKEVKDAVEDLIF